jgi:hypothetical protein
MSDNNSSAQENNPPAPNRQGPQYQIFNQEPAKVESNWYSIDGFLIVGCCETKDGSVSGFEVDSLIAARLLASHRESGCKYFKGEVKRFKEVSFYVFQPSLSPLTIFK